MQLHPRPRDPIECLRDRIDLVVMKAVRKRQDLGSQIAHPRALLRQMHGAAFDLGSLRAQGALFFPSGDRVHLCLDVVADWSSSLKAVTAL
jgi:hypothetical protein